MSVYAEYRLAETEEERQIALSGMKWEARRDEYLDKLYEDREDDEGGTSNLDAQEMAILNGTILPKGHGELVDRNDLKYAKYNSYAYAIANAPTIIGADKETENE